ncbi:MAG TPA: nuclear transport factor 2 family protein [Spongiibacteraceae bacterium]|jgi:ketosteroid isomerase-like protein|nr:nuclear transport factor 2 family protein [Spongiibacteraceae bacterium]HUH38715.1 nuclear transport factor 2 family protein [Spongiibacteraceae bacterium]
MQKTTHQPLVERFFSALEKRLRGGDADLSSLLHPDVQWHFPKSTAALNTTSDYLGKAAVLAMFDSAVTQYYQPDSIRFTYHALTAQADRVHVHFSMQALTSHGKPYHNDYQSLFRLKDDRIIEVWEYFDTAYVASLFQD